MVTTVCLRFSTEDLRVRRSSAINATIIVTCLYSGEVSYNKNKKKRTNIPRFSIESSGRASERASDVNEYTCEFQWTPVLDKIRMHPMRCLMKGGTMMSL